VRLHDARLRSSNIAEPVWEQWRGRIAELGGESPLLHFADTADSRIELSTTHPGGLAQFITGKPTMLSSLIRDDVALKAARAAADRIAAKDLELTAARGIDSTHLGIGLVEWRRDDVHHRAPILLRALGLRRYGRDFELTLRGEARLNPALCAMLSAQFGIVLDPGSFVALADDHGSFKPNAVIDRLRGLTSHLDGMRVHARLVVSTFADVATPLLADAVDLAHPVLDALAGNASAKWAVQEAFTLVEPVHADLREPATDTLLLDADSEQEHVVAQIAAGNSVVVKTLPGTGSTQTIVNALGTLVAQNKRVLVVSPRRATLRGIAHRFGDIGLPSVAVAPRTLRRDLIRSIGRAEKARQPQLGEVDDAMLRLRSVLLDYRRALARPDPVLGVGVMDCVTELSRLALLPVPPSTTARLGRAAVERLATGRDAATATMVSAARLGEFRYGPADSPWYGADFTGGDDAAAAHRLARRLHEDSVPRLLGRAQEIVGTTALRPFRTVNELGIYLRLLAELRDTLDKFLPAVFDRSVSELVAATAPRRDAPEMTAVNRRRLKNLAREYVRPGVHVPDLHEALTRIQQERVLWQRFAVPGSVPEVPVGLADVQVLHQQVAQDLAALDEPLGRTSGTDSLAALPLETLTSQLEQLAAESDVLQNLHERAQLRSELRRLDLDPLIADLAARHVPEEQVAAELELAWWRSVLERLLAEERALLGADTSVLDRLEADFRLVDEAHVAGNAGLLAWQLAENWRIGLIDRPGEAAELKRLLRGPSISATELHRAAPHLSRTVAPIWLASPYEIDQVPAAMPFDAVVLVDAGAVTLAETVGAIRRARQVVAFGDPVTQTPSPFSIGVADEPVPADLDDNHGDSALAKLTALLPSLALTRSYRAGGEDLAELVNRRFYGGRIESLPWAGSYLGHPSISVELISDGAALPDDVTGTVESVDGEVAKVVQLVLDHAQRRPNESLMVITASTRHAVRVQQAVLTAFAARTGLTDFIVGDRAEPFAVLPLEQAVAQSRDRVVFSVGYGRTPHGRVLSNFGALGEVGGERLLAVAMTRARRSMTIVSCFTESDVGEGRLQHGARALAEILSEIQRRSASGGADDDPDPMLVDLARRLEARGARVELGHRGKLGLVTSNGGICAVVETDQVLARGSLRESLRLRPELLRRLGWHYVRVHAFELFSDPGAVADRICAVIGVQQVQPMTEEIGVVHTAEHGRL